MWLVEQTPAGQDRGQGPARGGEGTELAKSGYLRDLLTDDPWS